MKRLIQASLVVAVLALSACSSTKKPADTSDAYASGGANGAQASGYGSGSEFGDGSGRSGRMHANNTYYFDYDRDIVRQDDMPAIDANARKLASNPSAKATVEGHTDPRGSREYNVGLGERRAKAVARVMETKGVNSSQVKVVSYGAERPAAQGHTEEDYALDRRAVLTKNHS